MVGHELTHGFDAGGNNLRIVELYESIKLLAINKRISGEKDSLTRAVSICQTDRRDHSCRNENFAFNQNYPARSFKS